MGNEGKKVDGMVELGKVVEDGNDERRMKGEYGRKEWVEGKGGG